MYGAGPMADDLWNTRMEDLKLNAAGRAAHYREQAIALRGMAEQADTAQLASDLRDLAVKYDDLASSVSTSGHSVSRSTDR